MRARAFLHAGPTQHLANGQEDEDGVEEMQQHVEHVIAESVLRAGLLIVQPEGEHEQRTQSGETQARQRDVGGIRAACR